MVRAMQPSAFRCEVLLSLDHEPSWPRIGDILSTSFPSSAGQARIEPQRGGHGRLNFGAHEIDATFVRFPSDAAPDTQHAAHVVLYSEEPAGTVEARLKLARLLTVVAGAVALRKDCAGAVWNEVPRVVTVDAFRRAAARIEQGRDPVSVWVDMIAETEMGRDATAIRTIGLSPFFGREIELEPGPEDPEDQRRIVGGVLTHLFADGAMIEHGSSFRIEKSGDFIAELVDEGQIAPGQVLHLRRLPSAEDAMSAVTAHSGRGGRRRCSAILLFDPAQLPSAAEIMRAIEKHSRRIGLTPDLSERSSDRLMADWGVVRRGGERKSEIIHRGWSLPEPLMAFITAENADMMVRHPQLLQGSAPILVREIQSVTPTEASILGATLLASLSAAILTLPGARGIIWPTSGVILTREAAEEQFRRAEAGLPIGLCVARLALELADHRRVFVTRGFAELGETDILMTCDDPADERMRAIFDSLVRAVFQRELTRKGEVFENGLDGTRFELQEEAIDGIGTVLKARMVAPPRPTGGLGRFLRKR